MDTLAFKIHFNGAPAETFSGDHTLQVQAAGILEVTNHGKRVAMYSPNFWTKVEPQNE